MIVVGLGLRSGSAVVTSRDSGVCEWVLVPVRALNGDTIALLPVLLLVWLLVLPRSPLFLLVILGEGVSLALGWRSMSSKTNFILLAACSVASTKFKSPLSLTHSTSTFMPFSLSTPLALPLYPIVTFLMSPTPKRNVFTCRRDGEEDEGVLLLLSVGDADITVSTGNGGSSTLPTVVASAAALTVDIEDAGCIARTFSGEAKGEDIPRLCVCWVAAGV